MEVIYVNPSVIAVSKFAYQVGRLLSVKPGYVEGRFLGSSEVLESIIGKFKCVAGERGQHGLTGMVLSIGALPGHVTVEAVQAALTEVPNRDVWNWCQRRLGPTLQSLRRRIPLALDTEQKRKPLLPGKT